MPEESNGGASRGPEAGAAEPQEADVAEVRPDSARAPPSNSDIDKGLNVREELASLEVDAVKVCGLQLPVLRRRGDYFAACAGDLPIESTGLVLWECGLLLADYLGYARWLASSTADKSSKDGGEELARPERPWWMLHPPAPVVPTRFWSKPERGTVLELGGGCGLVAAVLGSLGGRMVCTDGDPAALRIASQNCKEARRRYGDEKGHWGDVKLRALSFGDGVAVQQLVQELGPFSLIVGSDLLYGEAAPAGRLVETLAALAEQPGSRDAEVVLAVKNRCAEEVDIFCRLARARDLWDVRIADPDDLPEGYDCHRSSYGAADRPAYNVIHLVQKRSGEPEPVAEIVPVCRSGESANNGVPPSPKRLRCDCPLDDKAHSA